MVQYFGEVDFGVFDNVDRVVDMMWFGESVIK